MQFIRRIGGNAGGMIGPSQQYPWLLRLALPPFMPFGDPSGQTNIGRRQLRVYSVEELYLLVGLRAVSISLGGQESDRDDVA